MTIVDFIGPIQGMLLGMLLIIFRDKVAKTIQASFEKFPVYERKLLKTNVKPKNIVVLGIVFCSVALLGFVNIINS